MRMSSERGIALITTLMIMMLISALLVGFTAVVIGNLRYRGVDHDRSQTFYAASAGLEKLTGDLGNLFANTVAPTAAQVQALATTPPNIPGVVFQKPDLTTGYTITQGVPASNTISSGMNQGLIALTTLYTMDVTAKTLTGGEVHLQRQTQTVAIPVFQFGIFSHVDLSFFAGPNFDFGGRVHTNGNLFLAQGDGATLTLRDKVTAVGEVVRQRLQNGVSIDTAASHNGTINLATAPGAFRVLDRTEGSVVDDVTSALNDPAWQDISMTAYNSYIRNGRTGARPLNLALFTLGASNNELVRRPVVNENVTNPQLLAERYFTKASLRILLSDNAADITGLPSVTATAPLSLEPAAWPPAGYVVDATHPPIAATQAPKATVTTGNTASGAATIRVASNTGFTLPGIVFVNDKAVFCTFFGSPGGSPAPNGTPALTGCSGTPATSTGVIVTNGYLSQANTGSIGGFIKIEMQDNLAVWTDVTLAILNYGIAGKNLVGACAEPNLNAIIRIERLGDNPTCVTNGSVASSDYWPQTLFDPREGLQRDVSLGVNLPLGGVMHYVSIDATNLSGWLQATGAYAGSPGVNANNNNGGGYAVYFSDRRNNRNAANLETGEYGFEDFINPASGTGAPNGALDAGEDVNQNGLLDTYGQFPSYNGAASSVPPGAVAPLDGTALPTTTLRVGQAKVNRAVLFRRALKLVNGSLGNIIAPGLTVVAENPVYVQGNWNANAAGFGNPHVATSVIADAVTLLSNNWNDNISYSSPYNPGGRNRGSQTWYRLAIVSGKGLSFAQPAGTATDFGTDGGAHNFLRYLENGDQAVNYRGSIATFYYNRQAVGTYKCCTTVYSAPTRNYAFDIDFLTPSKLPPLTPVFRDLNTLGFSQETRPGK
jgi:Tfp pilus assembly protein PilX